MILPEKLFEFSVVQELLVCTLIINIKQKSTHLIGRRFRYDDLLQ